MSQGPQFPGKQSNASQQHARLVLHVTGQSPHEVTLSQSSYTIGRGTENDISLLQPASRRHGKLTRQGNVWHYTDLQSRNGTFVNGQKVQDVELKEGDILLIGDTQGNLIRLIFHAPVTGAEEKLPLPRVATPGTVLLGETMLAPQASLSIGRDPQSDIPLKAPNVSWKHARLENTPQGQKLVDLNSTNGTFVNGQRITGAYTLKQNDIIQIGNFRLVFDGTTLQQYDQRGGLRIDVRNMTLEVKGGRKILNDVTLSIAPREFVALVGGSGAGKSTLMKAISGFSRATDGDSSPVLVNGEDYYRNFDAYRAVLGYVPQDDILHRDLTVRKALHYTANLRLPRDMKETEVQKSIEDSLKNVEMDKHLATPVRSLSGGQRKRVSIASELLADPSLFFLDEPTSGLDPGLEKKMMYTLRQLADNGRTVLLVTHATENIGQCDHVVFMSKGHMVYFGPPAEALDFFGVETKSFSDIYTRLEADPGDELYDQLISTVLADEYQQWKQNHANGVQQPPLHDLWLVRYRKSKQYEEYVRKRQKPATQHLTPPAESQGTTKKTPRMSPIRQFLILTRRYTELVLRDRRNLSIMLLQSPIIGLLLWLLVSRDALTGTIEQDMVQRISAQNLLFVLAVVAIWFGVINSAREITKERDVYRRERLSNLSIFPYLMSKVTVLSVILFVQNVVLLAIVGLAVLPTGGVAFPPGSGPLGGPVWLEVFVTMMLTSLAGMSIGLLISSFSKNIDQAISFVPLILIPQILFAGAVFKIKTDTILEKISNALSYLMVSRWSLDALGTSTHVADLCQLPNIQYQGDIKTQCVVNEEIVAGPRGSKMVVRYDFLDRGKEAPDLFPGAFTYTTDHLLLTWGVLAAFIILGLIITAWFLKRQDRQV